jgi:hypothetical protein
MRIITRIINQANLGVINAMLNQIKSFRTFYQTVFLIEHQQPANIAMHMLGTAFGIALLAYVTISGIYWYALLFPLLHAAPGLLGHRLFERNSEVGDVRITRTDYPMYWFILGNHVMTWQFIFKGMYWRKRN